MPTQSTAPGKRGTKWRRVFLRPCNAAEAIGAAGQVGDSTCYKDHKGQKRAWKERYGSRARSHRVCQEHQEVSVPHRQCCSCCHVSPGSSCPSREAHGTPEASSETPAGQREASSHPLCLSEKNSSCINELREYLPK